MKQELFDQAITDQKPELGSPVREVLISWNLTPFSICCLLINNIGLFLLTPPAYKIFPNSAKSLIIINNYVKDAILSKGHLSQVRIG